MRDEIIKPNNEVAAVQSEHSSQPMLSAVVVVPDTYETVRRTMSHLQAQTVADQIEIVFVAPSRKQIGLDESELNCFHSWHIVEVGTVTSIGHGYVTGIAEARAPIIALTEDHSFPATNWGEVLTAAHRQPWASVGPTMLNGNPRTMLSWADFYQAYGEWTQPISSGIVRHLPGHNSSYKRDILLAFGGKLADLMQAESVLHRHLKAQGYKLLLETDTCTTHINFDSWSAWLPAQYYSGRVFAATWALSWSWPRRFVLMVASPLIPWVRLWRIHKRVRRGQSLSFLFRLLPILFLGLLAQGFGQMLGYVAGYGDSPQKTAKYEFHRVKYTKAVG